MFGDDFSSSLSAVLFFKDGVSISVCNGNETGWTAPTTIYETYEILISCRNYTQLSSVLDLKPDIQTE